MIRCLTKAVFHLLLLLFFAENSQRNGKSDKKTEVTAAEFDNFFTKFVQSESLPVVGPFQFAFVVWYLAIYVDVNDSANPSLDCAAPHCPSLSIHLQWSEQAEWKSEHHKQQGAVSRESKNVWRNQSCNLSFSLQTTLIGRLLCSLGHEKETEEKVAVCLCEAQDKNLKMLA